MSDSRAAAYGGRAVCPTRASPAASPRFTTTTYSSTWAAATRASCRSGNSKQAPAEGEELELLVVRFNADEGLYELSRPTAAVSVGNWDEVTEGQVVEVTITGRNKGGLECQVAGIRGFIPDGPGFDVPRRGSRRSSSASGWPASLPKPTATAATWCSATGPLWSANGNEATDKLMAELAPGQLREGIVREPERLWRVRRSRRRSTG